MMAKDKFSARRKKGVNMYKEIIISIVIIIIVLLGDFFSQHHIERCVDEIKENLFTLKSNLEMANKTEIENNLENITKKIDKFHESSAYYIEHDELEKVENDFTVCKSLANTGNFDFAISELNKTVFVLEHIADKYAFNLENIF